MYIQNTWNYPNNIHIFNLLYKIYASSSDEMFNEWSARRKIEQVAYCIYIAPIACVAVWNMGTGRGVEAMFGFCKSDIHFSWHPKQLHAFIVSSYTK